MNPRDTFTACGVAAAITLLVISPAWSQERTSQTPSIVGVWKLNSEKSSLRLPPDYMEIRQYSVRPDGFLVGLLITGSRQGYRYLQFVAKSDGKDYPEYSDQIVGDLVAAGTRIRRTYSERTIDDFVTEWTDKVDGRVTAHGRKTISNDRQTLTITADGSPQARVYDRQ